MSVGGIFCSCSVGRLFDAKVLDSVNRRSYMLFGERVLYEHELTPIVIETLLKSATYAMKYVSAKSGRDYRHDTTDLLKSMGTVVYSPQEEVVAYQHYSASKASNEQGYHYPSKIKTGLLGSLGVTELTKTRNRKHPDPQERFESFIERIPNNISYRGNGWSVAFVASMPYAVRLEHPRVPDFAPAGGYEKRVLIGNINSVINAFERRFGRLIGVKYGYIFETGGQELVQG